MVRPAVGSGSEFAAFFASLLTALLAAFLASVLASVLAVAPDFVLVGVAFVALALEFVPNVACVSALAPDPPFVPAFPPGDVFAAVFVPAFIDRSEFALSLPELFSVEAGDCWPVGVLFVGTCGVSGVFALASSNAAKGCESLFWAAADVCHRCDDASECVAPASDAILDVLDTAIPPKDPKP